MVKFTYKSLYKLGMEKLKDFIPDVYSFECFELLNKATGITREKYILYGDDEVLSENAEKFFDYIERRLSHEPLQYIIGDWEFYGLTFKVGEGVLIPRADTETIVDVALDLINENKYKSSLDLCSGSGAIAVALAHYGNTEVKAIELSEKAFSYLNQNIKLNQMEEKVFPIKADVLLWDSHEKFDLIVSNPPYIPKEDIKALSEEVQKEPIMALDGGEDGFDFYKAISKKYYNNINENGVLIFELGINQSEKVKIIMESIGYTDIKIIKDLNNIDRCIYGYKKIK